MWTGLAISALILSGAIVFREILRSQSIPLSFLIFALWFRYALSAFPAVTHPKIVAGFSINALGTLLIVGVGLIIVPKRLFSMKLLAPFYLFGVVVLISAAINAEPEGGLPVLLQAISVVVGNSTQSVDSLGRSFIGGYGHGSGFAMILLTFLLVAMFWRPSRSSWKIPVILWAAIGMGLANYRTGILSALPMIATIVAIGFAAGMRRREQPVGMALVSVTLIAAATALTLSSPTIVARFAALTEIFEIDLIKSPFEFTRADQDMLTGRLYIWSLYIEGYLNAGLVQKMIGFGPESWSGVFEKYAHNTFISYLYEYGIIGLMSFTLYWMANVIMGFRVGSGSLMIKFSAAYFGFTTLNFATMPLWQISGVIFLGLLNGLAAYAILVKIDSQRDRRSVWRTIRATKKS